MNSLHPSFTHVSANHKRKEYEHQFLFMLGTWDGVKLFLLNTGILGVHTQIILSPKQSTQTLHPNHFNMKLHLSDVQLCCTMSSSLIPISTAQDTVLSFVNPYIDDMCDLGRFRVMNRNSIFTLKLRSRREISYLFWKKLGMLWINRGVHVIVSVIS